MAEERNKKEKKKEKKNEKQKFMPDQGWAWVVLTSAFLCITVLDGIIFSIGIFFSELKEHFQTSDGLTSWIVSTIGAVSQVIDESDEVYTLAWHLAVVYQLMDYVLLNHAIESQSVEMKTSCSPIAGVLANRLSCRMTTILGSLIACAGFATAAFAPNVIVLLVGYGFAGGKLKVVRIQGIASSGSGVGMFIFGPLSQLLINYFTWHGAMLAFAGLALQFCVLGTTYLPVPSEPTHGRKKTKLCDASLLTDIRYLLLGASSLLVMSGYMIPFMYIVEVAMERHVAKFEATFLISIIGIANCIGRIGAGFLVNLEIIDDFVLYIGACIIGGAATMACTHLPSYGTLAAFCVIYGCFIACFVSVSPIIVVQLFGHEKLAETLGFLNLARGMGALVGPPLTGWLVDTQHGHYVAFYFAGIVIACGGLICIPINWIRKPVEKYTGTRRMSQNKLTGIASKTPNHRITLYPFTIRILIGPRLVVVHGSVGTLPLTFKDNLGEKETRESANSGKHNFDNFHDKMSLIDNDIYWNDTLTSTLLKSNHTFDKFTLWEGWRIPEG
ncbi:hypothetical protein CAPTEDRAFT_188870 [Capitella teleta]|uniref:Major facilitator superfamily (MFS) profile domain-containing protein n=1 Tax=Capitella teleta TaxID=283909 RepID=R7TBA7_CAPTE|nr:hypothetical protein CAPTEDRAFT_188870 [Capitella teleta]|eukprot:ELT88752.1 hypothetical protein CAPTEDRAFT_188870 [Capitella teleta]